MNTDELLKQHFDQDDKRFDKIDAKLDMLIAVQNKQKGFIAGFSAAYSLLAATVIGLVLYIWRTWTGGS